MGGLLDNNKSILKAKLNTHTDASGNLCLIRLGVTSRNGWHEISGAGAYRHRSRWPRPMYGTQRWFLGLEDFLINVLHIVDDQVEGAKEKGLLIT